MLQRIRDKSSGWIAFLILGAVIIITAATYIAHRDARNARRAAVAAAAAHIIDPETDPPHDNGTGKPNATSREKR